MDDTPTPEPQQPDNNPLSSEPTQSPEPLNDSPSEPQPADPSPVVVGAPPDPTPPATDPAQPVNQSQELPTQPDHSSSSTQQPAMVGGQPIGPSDQGNTTTNQTFVPPMPTKPKSGSKLLLIVISLVILAAASATVYLIMNHKNKVTPTSSTGQNSTVGNSSSSSYMDVIKEFIAAVQNGDAQKVASLQTAAFTRSIKSQTGKTNFYDACKSEGVLCTYYFSKSFGLSNATVTTKSYTAKNKTVGKEVDYTLKSTSASTTSTSIGSSTSSSSSTSVVIFDVVPSGNTWLIDDFNVTGSASATVN